MGGWGWSRLVVQKIASKLICFNIYLHRFEAANWGLCVSPGCGWGLKSQLS